MVLQKAVVELGHKFNGTITVEDKKVISTNVAFIIGFYSIVYLLSLRSIMIRLAGIRFTFWFFFLSTVHWKAYFNKFVLGKGVLLLFGLNILGAVLRIANRIVAKIESEQKPATCQKKMKEMPKKSTFIVVLNIFYNLLVLSLLFRRMKFHLSLKNQLH